MHALQSLLSIIQLEKITTHQFQGKSLDLGLPQVFGGQLMGQALYAAMQTIPEDRIAHSLHCDFLLPASCHQPIRYEVIELRDGRSFSTRQVIAKQNEQVLFYAMISFQIKEAGLEHQTTQPKEVPSWENLKNEATWLAMLAPYLPEPQQSLLLQEKAIEIRPARFINPLQGKVEQPHHQAWFRTNGQLDLTLELYQCLLAYASDFTFLPTALQPHGIGFLEPGVQIATLNHSLWFHRPVDFSQWLLYQVDSPSATNGRGFVTGQFFNQQGTLIASTAQEGIIRYRPPAR